MKKRLSLLFFFIVLFLGAFLEKDIKQGQNVLSQKTIPTPFISVLPGYHLVTKIVDGDTIQVQIDGKKETIRLIGVDTPEVVDPRKKVQCFGKEASAFTKETLLNKQVRLESDDSQKNKDKYSRLLRYVFLEDGANVNELIIRNGYGFEYTYDEPYKYQQSFKQAQKEAQENKNGLWSEVTCSGKK